MKRIVLLALALTMLLPGAALAKHRDRNHDGIPDRWEARHHLSTKHNVAHRDPDRDGLANIAEFRDKTNPRDADTDNDGVNDGDEMAEDTNPRRDDSDDDGVEDGQEIAGHVTSFDGTTLVITLNDNSTVSGVVDSTTRIKCEDNNEAPAPATTASTRDHGSDDSSGDDDGGDRSGTSGDDGAGDDNSGPSANSGPGNVADQSGDDQGDDNDQGDDRGDDNGENRAACSSADLTPGAVVHEADLEATSSGPVFEEVELVK
jgi:hypothetical protein